MSMHVAERRGNGAQHGFLMNENNDETLCF
jgi:hypothetical protein